LRINKVAAVAALSLVATGTTLGAAATSAGAAGRSHVKPSYALAVVSANPDKNLQDLQSVTVTASGFNDPDGTPLYVAECSPNIVSDSNPKECDQNMADVGVILDSSGGGTTQFTVHSGADFHATKKSVKCDAQHSCLITVTDGQTLDTTNYAGLAAISFGTPTKTKVAASDKKVKKGKKDKFTATTTFKGTSSDSMTGTVVFKDGKKTFAKVAEKKSGKVSAKEKMKGTGKHKIKVEYKGDPNFQASTGKTTVTVKK
jgi:hypothetical protein